MALLTQRSLKRSTLLVATVASTLSFFTSLSGCVIGSKTGALPHVGKCNEPKLESICNSSTVGREAICFCGDDNTLEATIICKDTPQGPTIFKTDECHPVPGLDGAIIADGSTAKDGSTSQVLDGGKKPDGSCREATCNDDAGRDAGQRADDAGLRDSGNGILDAGLDGGRDAGKDAGKTGDAGLDGGHTDAGHGIRDGGDGGQICTTGEWYTVPCDIGDELVTCFNSVWVVDTTFCHSFDGGITRTDGGRDGGRRGDAGQGTRDGGRVGDAGSAQDAGPRDSGSGTLDGGDAGYSIDAGSLRDAGTFSDGGQSTSNDGGARGDAGSTTRTDGGITADGGRVGDGGSNGGHSDAGLAADAGSSVDGGTDAGVVCIPDSKEISCSDLVTVRTITCNLSGTGWNAPEDEQCLSNGETCDPAQNSCVLPQPILHMTFNEPQGSASVSNDPNISSSNVVSGSLSGGVILGVASKSIYMGTAASFDGSGMISVPDSPVINPTDQITMVAWFRLSGSQGYVAPIMQKATLNPTQGYMIGSYGINVSSAVTTGNCGATCADWYTKSSTVNVNDSSWHQLAATYGDHRLRLYIDGQYVPGDHELRGDTSPLLNTTTSLLFGNSSSSSLANPFVGQIDNVYIYGVPLEPEQISVHYNNGIGTEETRPKRP
ncbi:MAG: LamG domain-containing protein [Candidatus Micrarchaeota archaeon]|nr:LamG domain-containing protein [Candidatus Micrarchaeota archaeon]